MGHVPMVMGLGIAARGGMLRGLTQSTEPPSRGLNKDRDDRKASLIA